MRLVEIGERLAQSSGVKKAADDRRKTTIKHLDYTLVGIPRVSR